MSEKSLSTEYAGFSIRSLAVLIDSLVKTPIAMLTIYNLLIVKSFPLIIFTTILTIIYHPLMEWRFGATLGKIICRIKVVKENLKPISIDQAVGRYIPWIMWQALSLLSYYYIFKTEGFIKMNSIYNLEALSSKSPIEASNTVYFFILMFIIASVAFDKNCQGIHDKIAKTLVIKVTK